MKLSYCIVAIVPASSLLLVTSLLPTAAMSFEEDDNEDDFSFPFFDFDLGEYEDFMTPLVVEPGQEIFNGNQARSGEFPFFVRILFNGQTSCGGSLISPSRVLTAAHCVTSDIVPTQVVVGASTTADGTTVNVACVKTHPNYVITNNNIQNDIAIIKLAQCVACGTPTVRYTTTPGFPSVVGSSIVNIGFGRFSSSADSSATLRKTTTSLQADADCVTTAAAIGVTAAGNQYLCTFTSGTNSCQGDSGGPALASNGQVVGVVSFGTSSACDGTATVTYFSEVANYHEWITNQLTDCSCDNGQISPTLAFSSAVYWTVTRTYQVAKYLGFKEGFFGFEGFGY